jgi:hypothetical protein
MLFKPLAGKKLAQRSQLIIRGLLGVREVGVLGSTKVT